MHVVSAAHVRSAAVKFAMFITGAIDSYSAVLQIVRGAHTVSSVVAVGFVAYAVDAHAVFSVQLRSECVPCTVLSYCADEQTVRSVQLRSEVRVRLVEMYCVALQLVAAAHPRSEVNVGALVSYSAAVHEVIVLQARSETLMLAAFFAGALD